MIKTIASLVLLCTPIITSSTDRELDCLARNIYYEARGESQQGRLAVALVTLNRLDHDSYPKTICGVVFQPQQFSWTQKFKQTRLHTVQWQQARDAAWAAYLNRDILGSFPATHFHNTAIKPNWKLKRVTRIGNHVFYV